MLAFGLTLPRLEVRVRQLGRLAPVDERRRPAVLGRDQRVVARPERRRRPRLAEASGFCSLELARRRIDGVELDGSVLLDPCSVVVLAC